MKIIVLVKQVPDTWGERTLDTTTGWLERGVGESVFDESGERALEVALRVQDSDGAEIVALTMGPASATDVLRKALSMGADSAIHVVDDQLAGADLVRSSEVLAAAITSHGFDLVVAGNESTDGRGGMLPAMIAERLGVPHLTSLNSAVISSAAVSGERATEHGTITAHTALPAVISVTERSPEARFPGFKGIMKAKKKPFARLELADLALTVPTAASTIVSVTRRPARSAGTVITDDGTAAIQLAEFLTVNRLV